MSKENCQIQRRGLLAAVAQSADAMVITDAEGNIQYVNPAFTIVTGYSSDEAMGQNPRLLKSGSQSHAFYQELWSTIRSGEVWLGQLINRRKDGIFYNEEMRITPILDENGRTVGFIANKRDVTERRATDEAQHFLAAIVESSEDAIIAATPAGFILSWNHGAEALLGRSAADAIGKHVSIFVPPGRQDLMDRAVEQVSQGHVIPNYEGLCLRKNGSEVPVSITGAPVKDSAGTVVAISGILRDLTGRKKAERAQALLASIVECSDEAIHSVSLSGTILSWNHGSEVMFGYCSQEIIGKNVKILVATDSDGDVCQCLQDMMKGLPPTPVETTGSRKDGCRIDISFLVSAIRTEAGEVVGASVITRDISHRLQAERKLLASEERFRNAFDHAPYGMCVTGPEGCFRQVNIALCQMLEYSTEDLLFKSWADLVHPDDREAALRNRLRLLEDPDVCVEDEHRSISRSGKVVWVRIRASLVRDSSGTPAYFVGHVEDITERKRAEEAFTESEERFRIMADGCPAIMWVIDAEGRVRFINRAYREFCGTTYESVEGSGWKLLVHPDDVNKHAQRLQQAVKNHTAFNEEVRFRRFDGEWRWVASHGEPRLSSSGEFLGLVGISPDITEQKQIENKLRETSDRLTLAARAGAVGIWDWDIIGNRLVWDEQMYRLYGAAQDQSPLTYDDFLKRLHPEDRKKPDEGVHLALQGKKDFSTEFRVVWPDGSVHNICALGLVQRDANGQPLRMIGTNWDITVQKQAVEELRDSNRQLEEATALANNLAADASAANDAKSQFLANMSHEIRTPMNGILGMTELALCTDLNEEQREVLLMAKSSADKLLAIINDILDYSRIEAGKIILEKVAFNVEETVGDALRSVAYLGHQKGLELAFSISPDVPCDLVGDGSRLRQVLINIIGNAIKFTERGEIVIKVECDATGIAQRHLQFSISDTGIGIPTAKQESVFQAFEQASTSTNRLHGGTGLGLAISRRIVELMGGGIRLESVPGQGTTVTFNAAFAACDVRGVVSAEDRSLQSVSVLILDDNATSRHILMAMARQWRMSPKECSSGDAGLAMLVAAAAAGHPFRLLLLDEQMPGMDGHEVIERIRADAAFGSMAIVMLTSSNQQSRSERGREMGVDLYLLKPVCPTELRQAIHLALGDQTTFQKITPQNKIEVTSRPLRILVAEDNLVNQRLAQKVLSRMGHSITLAETGSEALKQWRGNEFDLILMDVQMPEMDGLDATRQIRREEEGTTRHIPVVAMTAYAMSGDRERCSEAGMDNYISKPVSYKTVEQVIAATLFSVAT